MPPETLPPAEPASNSADISRRKLLKMITAAGAGASATVLLSSQWVKPAAAGGQLAPHAQISQPTTHIIVSGTAGANPQAPTHLLASAQISPADPNIAIVATVNVVPTGLNAPAAPTALGTQTANTNASGVANFDFDGTLFDLGGCGYTLSVVFTFANPADGTGSYAVQTPWNPCHIIVSGDAQQDQNQQDPNLLASCLISAADPDIPIVATVNATLLPPALAPAAPQVVVASQTANTNASGVASFIFPWDGFDPNLECNTDELEVVFSFANAADGTGTLAVTTPWLQPC